MRVIVLALWLILNGLRDTLPVLCAAALHEGGHYLALRLLGAPADSFRLSPIGAVMRYDASRLSYFAEAIVSAAGPLFGLIGTIFLLPGMCGRFGALFGMSSLTLSGFSLLPILPLDGGVICRALLSQFVGTMAAERVMTLLTEVGTVALWMCAVLVQLRCGGNLSLLLLSIGLLTRLAR